MNKVWGSESNKGVDTPKKEGQEGSELGNWMKEGETRSVINTKGRKIKGKRKVKE